MLWPWQIREDLEHRAIITMAGEIGECLLYDQADIPLAVRAADELAALGDLPEPDEAGQASLITLATAMDDPAEPTDQRRLAEFAYRAHGDDHMSATSWLAHLADQTITLVTRNQAKIELLAAQLAKVGELGGEAISELLKA